MIYLHKILPLILSPLFIIIIIFVFTFIFNSVRTGIFSIILLIILSLPIVSNHLIQFIERGYFIKQFDQVQHADAIVVLSGMVRTINTNNKLSYEWTDASDRIFAGIELIKRNKSSKLVLTQGILPWALGEPEGSFLKKVAIDQGVDAEKILLTSKVENTEQEAIETAELLAKSKPSIILVTSAFHMPRAETIFQAAGMSVEPFAVDFRKDARATTVIDFLPSAEALKDTSLVVREIIGRIFYSLKY